MTDPRMHAPAVARNRDAILAELRRVAPPGGVVLEVASGTGEHTAHFANALPALTFQPSDPNAERRASIDAWCAGLANVRPAIDLDAAAPNWPITEAAMIFCANMIHIAPWAACEGLMAGAGRVLPPDGVLLLYGPFRRAGAHTAPSNAEFDADLRARDPAWGVRDLEEVAALAHAAGFAEPAIIAMPANNFCVLWQSNQGSAGKGPRAL